MSVEGRKLAALIADHIERFPETYDQGDWGASPMRGGGFDCSVAAALKSGRCGTPACVAGWAVRLAAESSEARPTEQIADAAARLLGLTNDFEFDRQPDDVRSDGMWLFSGGRDQDAMPAVLRHYAETGSIDRKLDPEPWA